MTRKAAIEAAWKCDCGEQGCSGKHWPEIAAERAYDAGRIAGLREAARIKAHGGCLSDERITRAFESGVVAHVEAIRDRARELARKVRG